MKKLFLFAFFVSATSFSQNAAADALIQQISNRDAYIVMTKTISPRIHCAAGDAIVRWKKCYRPIDFRING
jgi:hypothetical protein